MECQNCRKLNPDENKFCGNCGEFLQKKEEKSFKIDRWWDKLFYVPYNTIVQVYCSKCGLNLIRNGNKCLCPRCGHYEDDGVY